MTPTEVIGRLLDLGICYSIKYNYTPLMDRLRDAHKEDFSQLGYAAENDEKQQKPQPWADIEVLTKKSDLWNCSQWMLCMQPPEKLTRQFNGPMITAFFDKKRRFVLRADDIPFGVNCFNLKFSAEHIKGLSMHDNLLLIETDLGQTGIMIPKVSNGA